MERLRRLLTDSEDNGRFRSGLGIAFGTIVVLVPLPFGVMDLRTFLIAGLAGVVAILPLWGFVEGPSDRPALPIAIVVMLVIGALILRELPYVAFFTFLGAWACTLSVIRFVTGWQDPQLVPAAPEGELHGGNRLVVRIVLIPLLVIVGLSVWGVVSESGSIR